MADSSVSEEQVATEAKKLYDWLKKRDESILSYLVCGIAADVMCTESVELLQTEGGDDLLAERIIPTF